MQSDCEAELSVRIPDGSENGGIGIIKLLARDCRTVVDPGSFDPNNPGNNVDEPGGVTWPDPDDDTSDDPDDDPWPDPEEEQEEEPDPTSCTYTQILMRTAKPTGTNWAAVSGVSGVDDCPGTCSCPQICGALMSDGSLSQAGTFYSVCVAQCISARSGVCTQCELSGPATLNPGEVGTWTDNAGNVGEASGDLHLVSRTVQEGYTFQMPMGGTGPFTVRACYGSQQQQCCEAEVDYPPCTLTGPSTLAPGADGYTPRAAYDGLKAACSKLYERSASWTEGKRQIRMRWAWKTVYHEGEAWAEIHFAPDMTPHIFMLGQRFVRWRLEYARGLRSVYSTNLLRLLMTQKDTGFKTITLADFRHTMEVPEGYRYADIKRYAILAPIKELNEKADMVIEWEETKRGRAVYSLQFRFKFVEPEPPSPQAELALE
jgi:hypothetical protein